MPAKKPKSILGKLPAELSCIRQCAEEMIKLRASFRSPVDPKTDPEQAMAIETERFLTDDMRILGDILRSSLPSAELDDFCESVQVLQARLLQWLTPYRKRYEEKEVMTLFGIVGLLSNPETYFKKQRRRK